MNEHPRILNTEMVQAVLAGCKTQTRDPIKNMPDQPGPEWYFDAYNGGPYWNWWHPDCRMNLPQIKCPFGVVGDLLYVREKHRFPEYHEYDQGKGIEYAAGHENSGELKWKPSVHMPKKHARIWLKGESIRVERIQDISRDDAIKEGVRSKDFIGKYGLETMWSMETPMPVYGQCLSTARMAFANFISKLHGGKNWNLKPSNLWDENPWVWVADFSVASTTGRDGVSGDIRRGE